MTLKYASFLMTLIVPIFIVAYFLVFLFTRKMLIRYLLTNNINGLIKYALVKSAATVLMFLLCAVSSILDFFNTGNQVAYYFMFIDALIMVYFLHRKLIPCIRLYRNMKNGNIIINIKDVKEI